MENDNMPHMALGQIKILKLCCVHTCWVYGVDVWWVCEFAVCAHVCTNMHQVVSCVCSDMGAECVNSVINCANRTGAERWQDKSRVQEGGEEGHRKVAVCRFGLMYLWQMTDSILLKLRSAIPGNQASCSMRLLRKQLRRTLPILFLLRLAFYLVCCQSLF